VRIRLSFIMRHNPSLSILRFPECVKETLSKDLRSIYTAPDKKTTLKRLEEVDKNGVLIIRQPCRDS